MMKNIFLFCIAFITFFSCERILLQSQLQDNHTSVFDDVWTSFNEKYALFEFKKVNWNDIKTKYRPLVSDDMSDDEFFNLLQRMIAELRDDHSWVRGFKPKKDESYDFYIDDITKKRIPVNFNKDILENSYLKPNNAKESGSYTYFVSSDNIAYVRIPTFAIDEFDLSDLLSLPEVKNTKGLVLDVRENGGGDPVSAKKVASHFVDKKYSCGIDRFKIGPGVDDFKEIELFIEPHTSVTYAKPVVVLINRLVYSATTKLVFFMEPSPNVSFLGSKTGGGASAPADKELANGWTISISNSELIDYKGRHLDDGFFPEGQSEIFIETTKGTTKDKLIEEAFKKLK